MSQNNKELFEDLIETCISSTEIFSGGMMVIKQDQVRLPSDNIGHRQFLVHPGAVIIAPILDNGNLLFERQFRYPLNNVFIELPAGKIDPGEDLLYTGQRELLEETGCLANEWIYLGPFHPCIGYSTEVIHMYVAMGVTRGQPQPDADEALQLFEMSLDEAMIKISTGEITDGKTIITLMWVEKFLNGTWQPNAALNP